MLPKTLLTRGNILKGMGRDALDQGRDAEAARIDQQVEATYQECLSSPTSLDTAESRLIRAVVWKQIGVFNNERNRYAYADDAYERSLKLQPDLADVYYNRAINQWNWGEAEAQAGRPDSAIAHIRQARIYAATSAGMDYPMALGFLQEIEDVLKQVGAQ